MASGSLSVAVVADAAQGLLDAPPRLHRCARGCRVAQVAGTRDARLEPRSPTLPLPLLHARSKHPHQGESPSVRVQNPRASSGLFIDSEAAPTTYGGTDRKLPYKWSTSTENVSEASECGARGGPRRASLGASAPAASARRAWAEPWWKCGLRKIRPSDACLSPVQSPGRLIFHVVAADLDGSPVAPAAAAEDGSAEWSWAVEHPTLRAEDAPGAHQHRGREEALAWSISPGQPGRRTSDRGGGCPPPWPISMPPLKLSARLRSEAGEDAGATLALSFDSPDAAPRPRGWASDAQRRWYAAVDAALPGPRATFKGTRIPAEGWLDACRLCGTWTCRSGGRRGAGAQVPTCVGCRDRLAAGVALHLYPISPVVGPPVGPSPLAGRGGGVPCGSPWSTPGGVPWVSARRAATGGPFQTAQFLRDHMCQTGADLDEALQKLHLRVTALLQVEAP